MEVSPEIVKQIIKCYRNGDQVNIIAHQLGMQRQDVVRVLQGKMPRGASCYGVDSRFRELSCKNDHTPEEMEYMEAEIAKAKAEVQATWSDNQEWNAAGRPDREYEIRTVDDSMPRR